MGHGEPRELAIELVYSPRAREVHMLSLRLPEGSTVRDAIAASGWIEQFSLAPEMMVAVGVWGRRQAPGHPLRDGDRVELYRPLTVDPKEARRLRYSGQRAGKVSREAPKGAPREERAKKSARRVPGADLD